MEFRYNDGGRSEAGFRGFTGDCVVRSIAIAAQKPYMTVYDEINELAQHERKTKRMRTRSNARTGVYRKTYEKYLRSLGFVWTPCMTIGSGTKVHLRADELPQGRLICRLSKHLCAVIDGHIEDTHDPQRDGTRCVYGYFSKDADRKP